MVMEDNIIIGEDELKELFENKYNAENYLEAGDKFSSHLEEYIREKEIIEDRCVEKTENNDELEGR